MLTWCLFALSVVVIFLLGLKIFSLKKNMDQVSSEFARLLTEETNGLITVDTRNPEIRKLARELNEELKTLKEQRRNYQNGDRELKEAVTNISHDLRTPLTAISGYLELLEEEEKSETVEQYLSFISGRTEAMKQLTEELFRYTVVLSAGPPELSEIDLREVLEASLLSFYGALTERKITPEIHLPKEPVLRKGNCEVMSRVFGNILSNVLKYSDGDLKVELKENGELTFSNHARDLDEVQVGKLFDRFFTVETARGSTGLGLSIARTLMEQMGERLWRGMKTGC